MAFFGYFADVFFNQPKRCMEVGAAVPHVAAKPEENVDVFFCRKGLHS